MLTINDLRKVAARPERAEKTVLTLYLDVDQSKQANLNRGFEKQLKDMLANVGDTIHHDGEMKAFKIASQRVEEFVTRYHVGARGLAMVFDASDGFFWGQEIDFPIQNRIQWSREVFVGPLAVAIDEYERVGIVLLDRANRTSSKRRILPLPQRLRRSGVQRRLWPKYSSAVLKMSS